MRRSSLVLSLTFLLGCGTEPGMLTLTVEDLPKFSLSSSIVVRGTVTREPPSDTPLILTIAGGNATVSDTVDTNFNVTVQLKLNQENQLSITAFDGTGSVANAIVVSVFHDDTGPPIVSSIPLNKQNGVALTTAIQVRYGEPLVQSDPSASFTLKHNSRPVPGTATLSGDKTLFTFQPDQPLEPASIYEMVVVGFDDEAGNPAGGGEHVCFITTFDPAQTAVTRDTSSSTFQSVPPPEVLTPMDMLGATLARWGPTLYGVFEFASERSLTGQSSRASIFIDIDLDNNPTTGFQSFKDFQFSQSFPELNTGLGVEMVISLDAHVVADSGFVGVNTANVAWEVIDTFLPGVCGRFFGFHTTTIFGDSIQDDGNFAYVYTSFAVQDSVAAGSSGVFADPVPIAGSFVADLIDPGMSALRAIPLPANRVWPAREVTAPLIRLLQLLQGR